MPTPFHPSEYQERIGKVEEAMASRGLDALVVTDPANMNYLTGYDGWSFYVPQAVLLVGGDGQPHWIGRPQDRNGARLTTWLDDLHLKDYPESYIQSPDHHPMDVVADLLRSLGCKTKAVGVEMDAYAFTALSRERLARGLPDARLADATLLVNWVRLVKSPAELLLMRQAAEIANHAMATAVQAIAPGTREAHAAAEVFRAQIRGTGAVEGDYPAIVPLMPSGERTSASHLSWAARSYEPGDTVNVELAGCVRRYHAPLARTVALAPVPPKLEDLGKAVAEGVEAALAAVRPGVTTADVEAAWQRVLRRHGFRKDSRLGYAVGLGYPPDWGEHTASLRQGDATLLSPGMTFHMIGGMWLDTYGLEISETFAVTETGAEVLTDFPRRLIVKDR